MTALDLNESPWRVPAAVAEAVHDALTAAHRYPPSGPLTAVAALAERHRVPPEQVLIGRGSSGVLRDLLARLPRAAEVVYPWRSFELYPRICAETGLLGVPVPLRDGSVDLDAMLDAVTPSTGAVLLCDPNNPTGTEVGRDALRAFVDRLPPGCAVLLDEAYRAFARPGAGSTDDLVRDRPDVVAVRSFSKAPGLAGLRIGYALGAGPLVAGARAAQLPFETDVVTDAVVRAVLDPDVRRTVDERVGLVVAERERMAAVLRAAGCPVPDSRANFLWLPVGLHADDLGHRLARRGIRARVFPGEGVRITVSTPDVGDTVLDVTLAWWRGRGRRPHRRVPVEIGRARAFPTSLGGRSA